MKRIVSAFKEKWPYYILEVLVIMIGILGAFGLNSWKEERINRTKEKELLIQIKENILRNMEELNSDINGWDRRTVRSLNLLLKAIESPDIYKDSIRNNFINLHRVSDPSITYAAYDALKDNGLEIIQSPTIQNEIINLFDISYRGMEQQIDELEIHLIKPTLGKYVYDHFYRDFTDTSTGNLVPNDYDRIIRSTELKNIVTQNLSWTIWFIELKENCLRESERVLAILEKEIND